MSHPRRIVPGATYLVTRRTLRRHHLLRPDAPMRELIVYALAVCSARYGVRVHAFCAMSTHLHLVVTDVDGILPFFLAQLHRIVALATKVLRKWEGPIWDHEQTSLVRLETSEAVTAKVAYVIANPVAAGLVRSSGDWPGAKSRVDELGRGCLRARRPSAWFDPKSWPDDAMLCLAPPADVAPADTDGWRDGVGSAVQDLERLGLRATDERGARILGARRAQSRSPYERASTLEAPRDRNPTFATGGVAGIYSAAARAVRAFREAYRAALRAWRSGVREVVFPVGTWWMARVHAVAVAT